MAETEHSRMDNDRSLNQNRPPSVSPSPNVYEPAGGSHSPPLIGNGYEQVLDTPTTVVPSSKRPRGRPKKRGRVRATPKSGDQHPPLAQNSLLEAIETWNTAKRIGVSSTEETVVLSGLRKSRRLMIMDGYTT